MYPGFGCTSFDGSSDVALEVLPRCSFWMGSSTGASLGSSSILIMLSGSLLKRRQQSQDAHTFSYEVCFRLHACSCTSTFQFGTCEEISCLVEIFVAGKSLQQGSILHIAAHNHTCEDAEHLTACVCTCTGLSRLPLAFKWACSTNLRASPRTSSIRQRLPAVWPHCTVPSECQPAYTARLSTDDSNQPVPRQASYLTVQQSGRRWVASAPSKQQRVAKQTKPRTPETSSFSRPSGRVMSP